MPRGRMLAWPRVRRVVGTDGFAGAGAAAQNAAAPLAPAPPVSTDHPPPLRLAIVADAADGLVFVLSDGQAPGLLARAPRPAAGAVPPALPAAVRAALAAHAGARLLLQPDPALPPWPWADATLDDRATGGPALGQAFDLLLQPLAAAPGDAVGTAPGDDVRQVTILACDLVDSTGLMHRLGDEAYSERLTHYHRLVATVATRHGGRADDPQGDDGFMCYFGYPVASEDAACNALRAGLALVAAQPRLGLELRVGISTGRVVIRDGQPVGAAVHHAARLQAAAGAGGVLVGAATRRIAGERFDFCLVDAAARLKGFGDSGAVWRVVAERPVQGTERFDSRPQLTPFIGREAELRQVQAHWQAAVAGQRQALLLCGEAGIGKSRLVHEFRRGLAASGHRVLESRCAPEHGGSAFWPLIDLLRRRLRIAPGDDGATQLARLRALQVAAGPQADEALAVLGSLLSLPAEVLPPLPADASTERLRQLTLAWLERVALGLGDQAPVCLIVEDVQWIDPSSRALVQRLLDGPAGQRVLLLLTQRGAPADAAAAGFGAPALPVLCLGGLPPDAACALLQDATGGALLGADLVRWLAARGDGVPLFIEESARLAAALAASRPAGDLAATLREAVPGTLRDLLMARLDQLPQAKRVAQLGSALGRGFSRALLEAVNAHPASPIRLAALDQDLATLVRAGLLAQQDPNDDGHGGHQLVFNHALVRDAAHQSLLERDRRQLHAAIADVLQQQFAALCASQPELLAQHLEQAGQDEPALAAWERAARHAAQRSAHGEANAHVQRALALLARQPAGLQRDATELRLQLQLAGGLIATAGYGADPVEAVYGRARVLCAAVGDAVSLNKVRMGLEAWHFMRGDFARAQAIAHEVAASLGDGDGGGDSSGDADPLARRRATWAQANILFHQGHLPQAVALTEHCLAGYRPPAHRPALVQDLGVICLCYAAWARWELGHADQALQRAQQAVALAQQLDHRFGLGQALGFLAVVHQFRGETDAGLDAARQALVLCEAGGFAVWRAHAQVLHGRLLVDRGAPGDVPAGLAALAAGQAQWAATGAVVTRPFHLALWAEALALAGQPQAALQRLDEALALVQRCGERYFEPELWRLKGQALLQAGAPAAEAVPWLQGGLDRARAMQLPALALRSAGALARLWAAEGRPAAAAALLADALAGLQEGQATRDLVQARALLASLG